MMNVRSIYMVLGFLVLMPFQNCGEPFSAKKVDIGSTSATCMSKIRAQAHAKAGSVPCEAADLYTCERRVFTPNSEDSQVNGEECIGSLCVVVDTRVFSTAEARSREVASEFQPGGEYNRQEVNCAHALKVGGIAVFVGSGDSLEEAMAYAQSACRGGS